MIYSYFELFSAIERICGFHHDKTEKICEFHPKTEVVFGKILCSCGSVFKSEMNLSSVCAEAWWLRPACKYFSLFDVAGLVLRW